MKIFVTGASGYIGGAVARELASAGHDVMGLTRRVSAAGQLEAAGIEAVVGDIRDEDGYRPQAETAEALVHVASEDSDAGPAVDGMALDALLAAAGGGAPRVLVYTSGCFILGETGDGPANEDAAIVDVPEAASWRPERERRVLAADGPGLAASVIRPGMVYGGRRGMFGTLFDSARREGAARYVGDGSNRWSPVYRGDVARLYRMVVERAGRGVFHCAEGAATVEALASAASRAAGAGGATMGIPVEEAREDMGPLADALTLDQVVGCARARRFGWAPRHAPFLESAEAVYAEWAEPGVNRPSGS